MPHDPLWHHRLRPGYSCWYIDLDWIWDFEDDGSGGMSATRDAKIMRLRERLFRLAMRKTRDLDLSNDMVSQTIIDCLMAEKTTDVVWQWYWASVCLMNNLKTHWRNSSRREVSLPNLPDEEIFELHRMKSLDNPELTAYVRSVVHKMDMLPQSYVHVMRLASFENTISEISSILEMPVAEVYWRLREGRKKLRALTGEYRSEKRGHKKFHGIRKDRHRYSAELRIKGVYHYLGYYGTDVEAAQAYDAAARRLLGADAKLNFPDGLESLAA